MRKPIAIWLLAAGVAAAAQETRTPPLGPITISSPDRSLVATVAGHRPGRQRNLALSSGAAEFGKGRTELLGWSPLGIVRDDETFSTLRLKGRIAARGTVSERYSLPHGKRRAVQAKATERVLHFLSPAGKAHRSCAARRKRRARVQISLSRSLGNAALS